MGESGGRGLRGMAAAQGRGPDGEGVEEASQ